MILIAWVFLCSSVGIALCENQAIVWPMPDWQRADPGDVGMDGRLLEQARAYALTGEGSGYITRQGKLVLSWGDVRQTYDLKSTTKSFGATAIAVAVMDGKMRLDDRAIDHHPTFGTPPDSNRETGWIEKITIRHLLTQTSGFEKPGGYGRIQFEPGSQWHYSDAGPNWLAECMTLAYRRDLNDLMFERVFGPLGIDDQDLRWRQNQYRDHLILGVMRREFGSGIHANVDAMARIGYLYLRGGRWQDRQIIPAEFVAMAAAPQGGVTGLPVLDRDADSGTPFGAASNHYGLLWWNNGDGTLPNVPRDAFWSWGLYDSFIIVIPSLEIVIARAGKSLQRREGGSHYDVLEPFLEPIVSSASRR